MLADFLDKSEHEEVISQILISYTGDPESRRLVQEIGMLERMQALLSSSDKKVQLNVAAAFWNAVNDNNIMLWADEHNCIYKSWFTSPPSSLPKY